MSGATDFESSVARVLRRTRPGEILTYGELAAESGFPGAARAVGNFLRSVEEPLPWWRVVNSQGRLHPHGASEQAQLLQAEGIMCTEGFVADW